MATRTDQWSRPAGSDSGQTDGWRLDSHARWLWLLALLLYVVGDILTTTVGLRYTTLQETGPLPRYLLVEFGAWMLAVLKLGTLGLFVGLWRVVPRPASYGVPIGLALVGCVVTLWNTTLIALTIA